MSLEKAKRREPDKASIREALGVAYLRMHRYQEAAAEFEHILAAAPANDYAHYCLGRCLDRMGKRRIALGHYKMAVWLRPSVDYYQEAVDGLLDDTAEGSGGTLVPATASELVVDERVRLGQGEGEATAAATPTEGALPERAAATLDLPGVGRDVHEHQQGRHLSANTAAPVSTAPCSTPCRPAMPPSTSPARGQVRRAEDDERRDHADERDRRGSRRVLAASSPALASDGVDDEEERRAAAPRRRTSTPRRARGRRGTSSIAGCAASAARPPREPPSGMKR